jgi:putative FmdB family regulatory protein
MPTYEYRCDNGHTFEVMQRMTDPPVTTCELCGAPVQRVFHPIAVHFKGKGFYNTDYGTRRRQRETLAAAEGTSKDGSSKESSSSSSDSSSSSNGAGSSDGKKEAKKDGAAASKTGKAAPKSG